MSRAPDWDVLPSSSLTTSKRSLAFRILARSATASVHVLVRPQASFLFNVLKVLLERSEATAIARTECCRLDAFNRGFLEKYRGRFDEGWDVMRARWFANQKRLGLIPDDTELAPRNPGVEAWEDLSDNQRRLACRLQEAPPLIE